MILSEVDVGPFNSHNRPFEIIVHIESKGSQKVYNHIQRTVV